MVSRVQCNSDVAGHELDPGRRKRADDGRLPSRLGCCVTNFGRCGVAWRAHCGRHTDGIAVPSQDPSDRPCVLESMFIQDGVTERRYPFGEQPAMDRRETLKKLALGGAIAAGGSLVLSSNAAAFESSIGVVTGPHEPGETIAIDYTPVTRHHSESHSAGRPERPQLRESQLGIGSLAHVLPVALWRATTPRRGSWSTRKSCCATSPTPRPSSLARQPAQHHLRAGRRTPRSMSHRVVGVEHVQQRLHAAQRSRKSSSSLSPIRPKAY